MTSTPSVRTNQPDRQPPLAPDRMDLVDDWDTPNRDRIELYADPRDGDGYVIAIGPYAPERAADITHATDSTDRQPTVTWLGNYADRHETWRTDQETAIFSALATWRQSC